MLSGAALLTADYIGTVILTLSADVKVLGIMFGLGFLILNLAINLYAGTIWGSVAALVQMRLSGLRVNNNNNMHGNDDGNNGNYILQQLPLLIKIMTQLVLQ